MFVKHSWTLPIAFPLGNMAYSGYSKFTKFRFLYTPNSSHASKALYASFFACQQLDDGWKASRESLQHERRLARALTNK